MDAIHAGLLLGLVASAAVNVLYLRWFAELRRRHLAWLAAVQPYLDIAEAALALGRHRWSHLQRRVSGSDRTKLDRVVQAVQAVALDAALATDRKEAC